MKRVLIVDDRPENLYVLRVLLSGHGYEVMEAHHGAEALTLARQSPPQLIISDLLMPVMDGYTFLRHWKADERLKGIPFIVYTATYTEPRDEKLALDLGADAFIIKPAEPDAFMTGIDAILAQAGRGELNPPHAPVGNDKEQFKEYSETLIRKLETKMIELVEANRALELEVAERKQAEAVLRARTEELRALAGRLQAIREEERTAIAREIHDVLAQELTHLKIDIAWINKRIAAPPDESIRDQILDKLKDLSAQTDTAIRTVQRIATELRPVVLDSLGLAAAIEWQIEDFEKRTDIRCRVAVPAHDPPLNRDQATACFRILQESLTNVLRHAQATKVDVKLCEEDGHLLLTISDNGRGIEPEKLHDPHSIGLVGMRERALSFGGMLEFTGIPGEGVTVTLRIPLLAPA